MSKTVQQYTPDNLPEHFMWQIFDFARVSWAEEGQPFGLPLDPPTWHPTYFIISDDQILISSATVLRTIVQCQNHSYKLYGIGNVLTYPSYRKQGYGRQVIANATHYIRQDKQADMALLQTAPHLEKFYGEHGWEHTPDIKTLTGDADHPIVDDGWIMMLFLSQRAHDHRKDFAHHGFYIDEYIW